MKPAETRKIPASSAACSALGLSRQTNNRPEGKPPHTHTQACCVRAPFITDAVMHGGARPLSMHEQSMDTLPNPVPCSTLAAVAFHSVSKCTQPWHTPLHDTPTGALHASPQKHSRTEPSELNQTRPCCAATAHTTTALLVKAATGPGVAQTGTGAVATAACPASHCSPSACKGTRCPTPPLQNGHAITQRLFRASRLLQHPAHSSCPQGTSRTCDVASKQTPHTLSAALLAASAATHSSTSAEAAEAASALCTAATLLTSGTSAAELSAAGSSAAAAVCSWCGCSCCCTLSRSPARVPLSTAPAMVARLGGPTRLSSPSANRELMGLLGSSMRAMSAWLRRTAIWQGRRLSPSRSNRGSGRCLWYQCST